MTGEKTCLVKGEIVWRRKVSRHVSFLGKHPKRREVAARLGDQNARKTQRGIGRCEKPDAEEIEPSRKNETKNRSKRGFVVENSTSQSWQKRETRTY